jgi:hypothetical protein
MKTLFGYLIAIGGGLGLAWCAVVGITFSGVYAMGCIGTRGREGCKEMWWMLGVTPVACLLTYLVYRLGRRMVRQAKAAALQKK